jgi:flagellin
VVTNPSSFVALRNLNQINRNLDVTQNRVSTGLKVTGALDDASNFAIAQGIRGEVRAIGAVIQGLNNAKGIGKVNVAALTAISNLTQDMRAKLTELANEGITIEQRAILTADYEKMALRALDFAENAKFNGVNLLLSFDEENLVVEDLNILSDLNANTLSLTSMARSGLIDNPGLFGVPYPGFDSMAESIYNFASFLRDGQGALAPAEVARLELNDSTQRFNVFERLTREYLALISSEVRALELQTTFLEGLSDATEEGLGNIVDADLARESAELTSIQVQQQLSTQTLGIANQRPQSLLGLFG